MQLYAITARRFFTSSEALVEHVALWAKGGVDLIQIREKDLATEEMSALATGIVRAVRAAEGRTRILLNGPAEIAIETGCDGVHLTAGLPGTAIADAKAAMSRVAADPVISVSCHTISEIERARDTGATLALFAPVFEKQTDTEIVPGQGLNALAHACRIAGPMPVFALGGVTVLNAPNCIEAGAAGISAIRLFAAESWLDLRKQG